LPPSSNKPDDNGKNGGWKPVQLLLLGGLGLGGAGTIGVGFEVNSARIEANQDWLARLQAHTITQDAEISALRRELITQIEMLRDESVPRELSLDRIHQFEGRLDRIQQELNALRDRGAGHPGR
jgi:hypothetical protein